MPPRWCTTITSSFPTSSHSPIRPSSPRRRRPTPCIERRCFRCWRGAAGQVHARLHYDATGGGDRSTLNLNALQLRDGSEQLFVGGRKLVRGLDYSISYDLGQVTFLNPDALFGQGSAQVTARFEERGLFAVAPTNILGLSTRYSLGDRGAINLIGMYQKEQSAFTRPALGFEASANLIGGINTELHFKPTGSPAS